MRRIGIFGTSGMARETRDIADALGYSVIFIARDAGERSAFAGAGEVVLESDLERFRDMSCVIGVGEPLIRKKIAARYAGRIDFINLIHPSATFGWRQREAVESREGVVICAGARFSSNISIGDFTLFNLNASVSHDCVIGAFATISPQACILGNVEVGDAAWIGAGAIINQGDDIARRMIGPGTAIGSGAVVLHDCEANAVYAGIPARKIK